MASKTARTIPDETAAARPLGELARDHASEALTILLDIARNGTTDAARVAACREVLDRAIGKPVATIEATVTGNPVRALMDEIGASMRGIPNADATH